MANQNPAPSFHGCAYLKTTSKCIRTPRWWDRGSTSAAARAWSAWIWEPIEQPATAMISNLVKTILSIVALGCSAFAETSQPPSDARLLPALRPYVNEVAKELGTISKERKTVLDEIVTTIV